MTINDWINLFGSLGLIASGSLLGSLITIIIKHFLDKSNLKTEREYLLQKEIYFKKVAAWERISVQLTTIHTEIVQYNAALSGPVHLVKLNVDFDERVKDLSIIEVWFSQEVKEAWNKINGPYEIIHRTFLLAQQGTDPNPKAAEYLQAITDFNAAVKSLKEKARKELAEEKDKIK
jgi:hypothetical protein